MSVSRTHIFLVVLLVGPSSSIYAADYALRQVPLTSGSSQLSEASMQVSPDAHPASMASGDFDGDGVVDLVVSYVSKDGAYLAVHRGNHDYIYPFSELAQQNRRNGLDYDSPFFPALEFVPIEQGFDFLAAGDFDADGNLDIAGSSRGDSTVGFLRGDGRGKLERSAPIELDGTIGLMQSGEVNRRDGMAELVVAIQADDRSELLVFESPAGAFSQAPERISLPQPASAVAMGELDGQPGLEIAIAAGNELILVHGRDHQLTLANDGGEAAGLRVTQGQSLDAGILGLAYADLVKDGASQGELSVLLDTGQVETLQFAISPESALELTSEQPATSWQLAKSKKLKEKFTQGSAPVVAPVFMDEQVYWLVNEPELAAAGQLATAEAVGDETDGDEILATLPLRLNADGFMDQVLLKRGRNSLQVETTQATATVTVNSTADTTVASDGQCTLREAILNTNNGNNTSGTDCVAGTIGADVIEFNIPNGGNRATIAMTSSLPTITDPVTINGNSQCATPPCIKLNGAAVPDPLNTALNALTVATGSSVIRGLVFANWPFGGIQLEGATGGNLVQGNHFGVDFNGTTATPNLGSGVEIESPGNTIGGTTLAARNIISGNGANGIAIINTASTNASGNIIAGNYIGTDITGTVAMGNTFSGVYLVETSDNTIGGATAGAGNLISANKSAGVMMRETNVVGKATSGNLVQGNYIGTTASGTVALGNSNDGVRIWDASGNTIGGTSPAARNIISGNGFLTPGRSGVVIYRNSGGVVLTSNNLVQGNYIGVDISGTVDLGNNGSGVIVSNATNNFIGGTAAGAGNVISGNDSVGVFVISEPLPATDNTIQGNRIGTNAAGTSALGNSAAGILLQNSADNTLIGGTTAGAGNVISDNYRGINIVSSENTTVQGNLIGTNATGTSAIGNTLQGIVLNNSKSALIGGTTAAARNIISGNGWGLEIYASVENNVQGNFIGTNSTGTAALFNNGFGIIFTNSSSGNMIGGTVVGAGNLVSGNTSVGIGFYDTTANNSIQGNLIGTNVNGLAAIPNGDAGIFSNATGAQTIGGDTPMAGNVISGNVSSGIYFLNPSTGNTVKNNYIGVSNNGTSALPNQSHGILLWESHSNQIGGVGVGNKIWSNSLEGIYVVRGSSNNQIIANDISNNTNAGILVQDDTTIGNKLSQNLISNNGSLGISLNGGVPVTNDNLDPDTGPNNLQNYPILATATAGGSPVITGTLKSLASTQFNIEYFSNSSCDLSGNGEGQFYLGFKLVNTNGSGVADVGTILSTAVSPGFFVTATATAPDGSTSEFSPCVATPGGGPIFKDGFETLP